MRYKFYALLAIFVSLSLAGCSTSGMTRQEKGAAVGGTIGALLGYAITGDRKKGAILGGIIGASTGGIIAANMDKRDKDSLEAALKRHASKSNAGDSGEWKSDHTAASATFETVGISRKKVAIEKPTLEFDSGANYNSLGRSTVLSDLNVRGGRGMDFPVIGTIPKSTVVDVYSDSGKFWVLVGSSGSAIGFVSSKYLEAGGFAPIDIENAYPIKNKVDQEIAVQQQEVDIEDRVAEVECKLVSIRTRGADGRVVANKAEICQDGRGSYGA